MVSSARRRIWGRLRRGNSKIVSFVHEDDIIRRILKHCNLWKEPVERPPPAAVLPPVDAPTGITYDIEFFNSLVG